MVRPVALTPLVMKAMERIIKNLIISVTDPQMDPFLLPYRAGRGANDAKTFITETVHKHLEHPSTTTRLQPHILAEKLSTHFHLDDQLIR